MQALPKTLSRQPADIRRCHALHESQSASNASYLHVLDLKGLRHVQVSESSKDAICALPMQSGQAPSAAVAKDGAHVQHGSLAATSQGNQQVSGSLPQGSDFVNPDDHVAKRGPRRRAKVIKINARSSKC